MSEAFPIPKALTNCLRRARRVVVLTGAGVSAESRIPTFRDAMTGIWARYRAEDLATPEAFLTNPQRVWDWYQWRKSLVSKAQPNPGHYALAAMETKIPQFLLVTQNVDGLHERAGSPTPLELHGNLLKTKCFERNHPVSDWEKDGHVPPRCPRCGGTLRPDVVWFGEPLPGDVLAQAMEASASADLFLSVGTSAMVQPAASLIYAAGNNGAVTVEVNPNPTHQAGQVTHALNGPAGVVLPALVKAAWFLDVCS